MIYYTNVGREFSLSLRYRESFICANGLFRVLVVSFLEGSWPLTVHKNQEIKTSQKEKMKHKRCPLVEGCSRGERLFATTWSFGSNAFLQRRFSVGSGCFYPTGPCSRIYFSDPFGFDLFLCCYWNDWQLSLVSDWAGEWTNEIVKIICWFIRTKI